MVDVTELKRPFAEDDIVNANIYEVATQIDRILHKVPIEDHAAILGMIQVTTQRRAHEHEQRRQKQMQAAQQEAARRSQFALQ